MGLSLKVGRMHCFLVVPPPEDILIMKYLRLRENKIPIPTLQYPILKLELTSHRSFMGCVVIEWQTLSFWRKSFPPKSYSHGKHSLVQCISL